MQLNKDNRPKNNSRPDPVAEIAASILPLYTSIRDRLTCFGGAAGYTTENTKLDFSHGIEGYPDNINLASTSAITPYLRLAIQATHALHSKGTLDEVLITPIEHPEIWNSTIDATRRVDLEALSATTEKLLSLDKNNYLIARLFEDAAIARNSLNHHQYSEISIRELIALHILTQIARHPDTYESPPSNRFDRVNTYGSALKLINSGWHWFCNGTMMDHVVLTIPEPLSPIDRVIASLIGVKFIRTTTVGDKLSYETAMARLIPERLAAFAQTSNDIFGDMESLLFLQQSQTEQASQRLVPGEEGNIESTLMILTSLDKLARSNPVVCVKYIAQHYCPV